MSGRYIVLAGSTYYPAAWQDFRGSRDTIEEAVELAEQALAGGAEWFQIIDKETDRVREYGPKPT